MIYITGDKHGRFGDLLCYCTENNLNKRDIIIILGDAGINYHLNENDTKLKKVLKEFSVTFFCIHGNHEERPENLIGYKTKEFHKGIVYYEDEYPNILFAKDGEIYEFNKQKVLVIGGAYSVDKDYRIAHGINWFSSEQINDEVKEKILKLVENKKIDVILSHTCPFKYEPTEMFLPFVDQSNVDRSTEMFLDKVEEKVKYKKWYCGHFHTDKEVDKVRFMYNDIEKFK